MHCTVADIVLDAYAKLAETSPEIRLVYGETGFAKGGVFKPHKTHQNGLSVDFFVPVRDAEGKSVKLPTHALNKWGYDIEFDTDGRYEAFKIDFEAMAAHILALYESALERGVDIWRVIFAPELQSKLHSTAAWSKLRDKIQFSERRSWVRHDEHYHVDFEIACEPL